MVGLLASGVADPFSAQFCGGAAVTSTKVVTAAHCVVDGGDRTALPSEIQVLTGTSTLSFGSGTRHTVTSIAVHPSFTISEFRDDVRRAHRPHHGVLGHPDRGHVTRGGQPTSARDASPRWPGGAASSPHRTSAVTAISSPNCSSVRT